MTDVLLNPGPTNTRFRTKYAQWISSDVCHRTEDFMALLGETKNLLLNDFTNHNIAILAGSGTTAMEAMICSLIDDVVIINAGIYGQRAIDMMKVHGTNFKEIECDNISELKFNADYKNVYFVENETTTGEKFSVEEITKLYPNATLFVDATSAFGASDYSKVSDRIGALCFCSNKCLQSTPGLGIVIFNKNLKLIEPSSYYLNLKKYIGDDIPFTLPVQSVAALNQTLKIVKSNKILFDKRSQKLIDKFESMGIECVNYMPSNSILGFKHPSMNYEELRRYLSNRGIVIYSGIKGIENSFRVSTMSVLFDKKFNKIVRVFNETYLR
tara:strand:+ start:430 stop:1410 length:981 start_codon:yes stop_codon:yes gene_type:complete